MTEVDKVALRLSRLFYGRLHTLKWRLFHMEEFRKLARHCIKRGYKP